MIIHEVKQGSIEWHELKHATLGGTGLKDLMVDKPVNETSVFDRILAEMCEDFVYEDGYINDAMQRGNDLEPIARKEANEYFGLEFKEFGWLENETNSISGCSPDGLTLDFKTALEIKCPSATTHVKYMRDGVIPKEYFWQVINYFMVNKELEDLHFVSYRPENIYKPLFVYSVKKGMNLNFKVGRKSYIKTVSEWAELAEDRITKLSQELKKEVELLEF